VCRRCRLHPGALRIRCTNAFTASGNVPST
jgi:hypothetical protein